MLSSWTTRMPLDDHFARYSHSCLLGIDELELAQFLVHHRNGNGSGSGRVFHTRTRPMGLPRKPGPNPFIKQIFFLTLNSARWVPAMPQFGPKPWPNPKKKNSAEAHTMAQKLKKKNVCPDFLRLCLPRFRSIFR